MVQMTNWIWYWFQWQPSYDRQGHMQARTNYAGCWALVGLPLVLSLPHGHPQTEVKLYTKYKFTVILILMSIWLYLTIQSYIPLLWLPNAVCFAQNTWSCTLTELWLCKVKEWEEEGSENAQRSTYKIFSMHWPAQHTSSKGSWSISKILITAYKLCLHGFKTQKYTSLSQDKYPAMKNTFCIAKVLNHVLTKHLLSKHCYAETAQLFQTKCTCQDFGTSLLAENIQH